LKLALGTVQFGQEYGISNVSGKVPFNEAKLMMELISDYKIDTIDTAINYGDSERCLGLIGVSDKNIITKLPKIPEKEENIENWVFKSVENSIKRLNINYLHGLLLHDPNQLLLPKGKILYNSLEKLKKQNFVKKIGISVYQPNQAKSAIQNYDIDIVQLPCNVFDQRFSSQGVIRELYNRGIEVHVRSVFLQGLLLMPYDDIPEKFMPWNNLIACWHKWLQNNSLTPLQGCLAFVNSIDGINKIVVGAENTNQLRQIINDLNINNISEFPDISSEDENLINPGKWPNL
tara:strand:+ start:10875 stop:11741 length:867 start_codon:yes stop_codon:yes gene_type:complete